MTAEQAVSAYLTRMGVSEPGTHTQAIFAILRGHGWRETNVQMRVHDWRTKRQPDPPSTEWQTMRRTLQHPKDGGSRPPPAA